MEWAEEHGVVEEDSSPYDEIVDDEIAEVEEDSSPYDEIVDDEIADPLRALAALLEAAFPDVSSPLCFGVSLAMVDPIPSVYPCSPPPFAAAAAAAAAAVTSHIIGAL